MKNIRLTQPVDAFPRRPPGAGRARADPAAAAPRSGSSRGARSAGRGRTVPVLGHGVIMPITGTGAPAPTRRYPLGSVTGCRVDDEVGPLAGPVAPRTARARRRPTAPSSAGTSRRRAPSPGRTGRPGTPRPRSAPTRSANPGHAPAPQPSTTSSGAGGTTCSSANRSASQSNRWYAARSPTSQRGQDVVVQDRRRLRQAVPSGVDGVEVDHRGPSRRRRRAGQRGLPGTARPVDGDHHRAAAPRLGGTDQVDAPRHGVGGRAGRQWQLHASDGGPSGASLG